jgi:hypothetical protein
VLTNFNKGRFIPYSVSDIRYTWSLQKQKKPKSVKRRGILIQNTCPVLHQPKLPIQLIVEAGALDHYTLKKNWVVPFYLSRNGRRSNQYSVIRNQSEPITDNHLLITL